MGSGTLFVNIVAGQCPAAMGINNNSAKSRLTSMLNTIFLVTALLKPSWHCQIASWVCRLVQRYDEPGPMRLLWRSWLHTTLSVRRAMMMMMMLA